jgi:CheY-like chemotaxis protein
VREQPWAKPGEFAVLRVRDTGCGMTPGVVQRIFEPFFTTKGIGKGTGLGLSTVYGIVQQHHGLIAVQSAPNAGSTFSVYWPVGGGVSNAVQIELSPAAPGSESILLVDDNDDVRHVLGEALQQAGYRVMSARGGAAAVAVLSANLRAVDAVVLDLTMPEMSGIECYRSLMALRPNLPVLFCSGWADSESDAFLMAHRLPLLPKPVASDALLRAVRDLLDDESKG